MKPLILILMFFITIALFILANNDLPLYKKENLETFSELYLEWLDQIYINTNTLLLEVIEFDWLP